MPDITSTQTTDLLRAGLIRRPHGVGGELRVEALGDDPSRFRRGVRLTREDTGATLTVRTARAMGDGDVLIAFEEMPNRDDTSGLNGVYLCVDRRDARRLGKDEWFVRDLIGLRAVTPEGDELGVVSDVEAYPAHDVVVVGTGASARRFPMVKEFVAAVDIDAGTMTLTPWDEV